MVKEDVHFHDQSNFSTDPSAVKVSFAGTDCPIATVTGTQIVCTTDAHSPSEDTKAVVEIGGNGIATQVQLNYSKRQRHYLFHENTHISVNLGHGFTFIM